MGKSDQAESMSCNEAVPYDCSREELVAFIRGTEIVIPDFQSLLSHWPARVHEEVGRLSEDVQRRLESIFTSAEDKSRIQWLTACKLDLFGASWWPCASFEKLVITTALAVWLFAWDDETDSLEFSPLLKDFEKSCKFREETIRYLEAALSLSPDPNTLNNASNDRLITNFLPIGQAIARSYDDRQLNAFLRELRFFVEMNEEEQQHQMTAALPSVEDYIRRREGTSATRVCLALHEYAIDLRLPAVIMESMEMQAIWHESNMIISTMNDVLSLKKEVDQTQVDTLIPLLSMRLGSVQAAISKATDMVCSSIERFEAMERQLLQSCMANPQLHNNIQVYIDSCKYACTANLNWRRPINHDGLACDYDSTTGLVSGVVTPALIFLWYYMCFRMRDTYLSIVRAGKPRPDGSLVTFGTAPMLKTSRSSIKLASANCDESPLIDPNYLGTTVDRYVAREAVKTQIEFAGSSSTVIGRKILNGEAGAPGFDEVLSVDSTDDCIAARIRAGLGF
ncbi:hypothetical protein FHL15_010907 [Xylaria flabelliformis]|uniref:Terpene synthase n=1 Tax=Xylaria flabelliformis TaxID=2512241 RepID=A0A553HJT9_9PEZI|nr:hypothetical protein FHL15_010907 [Xylaria flabelliformis]